MQRNIVIVMSRCSQSKAGFGMRFERGADRLWRATWAFALKEAVAKREGYEQSQISGLAADWATAEYPGCPHCRAPAFFQCNACRRTACWDGATRVVTCPSCGEGGELAGQIVSLDAGTDR
jgi:hypothetical protein